MDDKYLEDFGRFYLRCFSADPRDLIHSWKFLQAFACEIRELALIWFMNNEKLGLC